MAQSHGVGRLYHSHSVLMDDIPPTARWANRILRPLTSIYRRLEKHHENLAIIATESRTRDPNRTSNGHAPAQTEAVTVRETYSGSDADEDEGDPVWIPGKKIEQRRVRHKYSSRGERKAGRKRTRLCIHSPETPRTLPGAIELPTPLITGKKWEIPSSARSQPSAEQVKPHRREQLEAFRDKYPLHKSPWQELLGQTGDPGFASIAHNLDRVLQNFLCNTRISKRDADRPSSNPGRGARSLMSMVVRQLPKFIAGEQELQDEADENGDEDMCDAYFTELEMFYAPHGKGWKPLREAVRAQGIFLVSTMIQKTWVTSPVACALIEKCRYHEPDACESLLATFLSTCTSYPYPQALKPVADSSLPGDAVRLLRNYASFGPAHRSYVFEQLSKLLMRGVLPPEWMATKVWTSWMTRATISFSKGDDDSSAASRLIEAVLITASDIRLTAETPKPKKKGRPPKRGVGRRPPTRGSYTVPAKKPDFPRPCPLLVEDALSNHVMSLMAALCGMHISRSREVNDGESPGETEAGCIIKHLSFALEEAMNTQTHSQLASLTSHQILRRGCIILSGCLLQCNDTVLAGDDQHALSPTPILQKLCESLNSHPEAVKELASLLRLAFRCFGSATEAERLHLRREVRRMVSMFPHLTTEAGLSTLLGRVAIEAAMQFAEGTGEPDDHLWAVEVQETVIALQNGQVSDSELTDECEEQGQPRGYRWEESIGEWVARTPAAKISTAPNIWATGRVSVVMGATPCIPCSTDTSSPVTDRSEVSASSLTSSPSSVGVKRNLPFIDSSPLRTVKRRQSGRVVMVENSKQRYSSTASIACSRSPSLEPHPSDRRILRELPNPSRHTRAASARNRPASKVEGMVINQQETTSDESQPAPTGSAEKQEHRMVERRRQGRPRLSIRPTPVVRVVSERRSIIPCSEDDSDDELSFI